MPRQSTQGFPSLLEELVRDFTRRIEELVRIAVQLQLENAVADELKKRANIVPTPPVATVAETAPAPREAAPSPARGSRRARARALAPAPATEHAPTPTPATEHAPTPAPATERAPAPAAKPRAKRICPVPGCDLLAAGPKYRWRCRQHKNVSNEEIAQMRAGKPGGDRAAPSAVPPPPAEPSEPAAPEPLQSAETATDLLEPLTPPLSTAAAHLRETRSTRAARAAPGSTGSAHQPLPPPPSDFPVHHLPPGPSPSRERRDGPSMECRYPGCTMKSKGFRYDYFCWEHYNELNKEQRAHFKKLWQAAREKAATTPAAPATPAPVIVRRAGHEAVAVEPEPAPGAAAPQVAAPPAETTEAEPETVSAPALLEEPAPVPESPAASAPAVPEENEPEAAAPPTESGEAETEGPAPAEAPVEAETPLAPTDRTPAEAGADSGEPASSVPEPVGSSLASPPLTAVPIDGT